MECFSSNIWFLLFREFSYCSDISDSEDIPSGYYLVIGYIQATTKYKYYR